VLSRGFRKIFWIFFEFDKNRQKREFRAMLPYPLRIFTEFFQKFHRECVYKLKIIWYTIRSNGNVYFRPIVKPILLIDFGLTLNDKTCV
jgi:hypothetical protein